MPSLYQTTPETGTVSSSNSTSLYSNTTDFTTGIVNSSVYSVNGGTGVTVNPTTGNVLVSIGQDVATTANPVFAGATLGNVTVGVATNNTITTSSGQLILQSATGEIDTNTTNILSTNSASFLLLNSPTTVTAFNGATSLELGANGGLTNINGTLEVDTGIITNNITVAITDNQTITTTTGELRLSSTSGAIALPSITSITTDTTGSFGFLNQPTTVNAFVAATTLNLGADTGTTNINNDLLVEGSGGITIKGSTSGSSTFAAPATGSVLTYVLPGSAGAANTVLTNNGSGTLTWALPGGGGSTFGNVTVGVVTDNTISTTTGALVLQSAIGEIDTNTTNILSTNSATFGLLNSPTTVNAFQSATTIDIGAATGTTNINNDLLVNGTVTGDSGDFANISIGVADNQTITTTTGELRLSSASTAIKLPSVASIYTDTTGSFGFLNQPTTVNAFVAATSLNFGANTGTTNINNDLLVEQDVTMGTDFNDEHYVHGGLNFYGRRLDNATEVLNAQERSYTLVTSATTANQNIFTVAGDGVGNNDWAGGKFVIMASSGGEFHMIEMLVLVQASTDSTWTTEYAELYSSVPLATFGAERVSTGTWRVNATPVNAVTTFKTQGTLIASYSF